MAKHKHREHAPLSPSGAKRWISCPGSYAASEGIITKPSEAALEGTRAHEWSERLRKACSTGDPNDYARELAILESIDEDMAFYVDNYIDFLDTLKTNFQSDKFDDYEEYLESRVHYTENIWGTLDYGCVRSNSNGQIQAIIADLKYGRGVYVEAKENPQLIVYLIGLEEYIGARFDKAWIYIYQPRIPKDKPYEKMVLTRKDIDLWRDKLTTAEHICLEMKEGNIPIKFKAGDHCQFCPAQPQCPTFKAYAQSGNIKLLDDIQTLPAVERIPIESLILLHKKKKQIEHFLENVDHFLLMRGLNKQDIGDLKIVEGRSNRRWNDDETEVAEGLKELGAQPWKKKLITIGEAEKIVGKNKIDHLTSKPPGKLQLASPEDERPTAQLGKDSIALLD